MGSMTRINQIGISFVIFRGYVHLTFTFQGQEMEIDLEKYPKGAKSNEKAVLVIVNSLLSCTG